MPVTQCAAHVPSGTALCFESVKNPRSLAGPVPTRDITDILRACPHGRHAGSQGLSPRVINKVLFEENGIGVPTDCIKLS